MFNYVLISYSWLMLTQKGSERRDREWARAGKGFRPSSEKVIKFHIFFLFAFPHSCGTINYDTMIMLSFKALPVHKHTHSVSATMKCCEKGIIVEQHSRWIFDNFNTHDSLTPPTKLHTLKEGLDNKNLCFTEIFWLFSSSQARSCTQILLIIWKLL